MRSQDAQGAQSRNKEYQKFRLHHARKCSQSATNEDVFHTRSASLSFSMSFASNSPPMERKPWTELN